MNNQKIILASTSPRRKELAQTMGLDFEIVPSNYEEDMLGNKKLAPKEMVKMFAFGKANDVAKKLKEGIVIGVDTIGFFEGKKLGKPKSEKEAFDMIKSFSGKSVKAHSGICLIDVKNGKIIRDYEITDVKFRKLSEEEIKRYISTGEPMDKAGAFAIQGLGSIFIKKINGCYFNVMGFPIYNIYKNLSKLGVNIFEYERWNQKK